MRFLLALIALSALSAFAQTTPLFRTGVGSGVIVSPGCTNATPIVCTSSAAHGLVDNNRVVIENVLGNTAANGTFYIDSLTSTTFALYSASGPTTAVAGTGAWVAGTNTQRFGKALPNALTAHPRVLMPGPTSVENYRLVCSVANACLTNIVVSGTTATATIAGYTHSRLVGESIGVVGSATSSLNGTKTITAVTSTTLAWTDATTPDATYTDGRLSEYALTTNPAWAQLVSADDSFNASYNLNYTNNNLFVEQYANAALRWHIDGTAAALTRATWLVEHPWILTQGTLACAENVDRCGDREQIDYGREGLTALGFVYSIIEATLSGGQKSLFANQVLNDPMTGSCTYVPITSRTGTLSQVGTTITGIGTTFTSQVAVGDTIWADWDGTCNPGTGVGCAFTNRNRPVIVTGITNDLSMTVSESRTSSAGLSWDYSPPWTTGNCGVVGVLKHATSSVIGDPTVFPPSGGLKQDGGGTSEFGNLPQTALMGYHQIGLALADQDARAVRLLQGAWLFNHDMNYGYDASTYTGVGHLGPAYSLYRMQMIPNICYAMTKSVIGYPDMNCAHWGVQLDHMVYMFNGQTAASGLSYGSRLGQNALADSGYWIGRGTAAASRLASSATKGYFKNYLTGLGYGTTMVAQNGSRSAWNYFLGFDPQVAAVSPNALPLARVFNVTNMANCSSLGMESCTNISNANRRFDALASRSTWSNPAVTLELYGGTRVLDHWGYQHPAMLRITRGTTLFLGSNMSDGANNSNGPGPDGETGPSFGSQRHGETGTPVVSARFTQSRVQTGMAYAATDHRTSWVANPTRAMRHVVHIGEYVVAYDDGAGTAAGACIYEQWHQNGQASEGITSLTAPKVTSQSLTDTIVAQHLSPANTLKMTLTSGLHADALKICPSADGGATFDTSATSMEMLTAWRSVSGTGDTTLVATAYNPDANWTGAQWAGTGTALVTMFSRAGSVARTSVPAVTTTVTAPYFASGLAPGTYAVKLGGVDVSGCSSIAVVADDNSLYCALVGAGVLTVATTGGGPPPPSPSGNGSAAFGGNPRGGMIR